MLGFCSNKNEGNSDRLERPCRRTSRTQLPLTIPQLCCTRGTLACGHRKRPVPPEHQASCQVTLGEQQPVLQGVFSALKPAIIQMTEDIQPLLKELKLKMRIQGANAPSLQIRRALN